LPVSPTLLVLFEVLSSFLLLFLSNLSVPFHLGLPAARSAGSFPSWCVIFVLLMWLSCLLYHRR
jgi:hypothetical protein